MVLWQLLAIVGIIFLILEMFVPSLFFMNFALAAFLCAIVSLYIKSVSTITIIFFILSFVSFGLLRPILKKTFNKANETGINSKYIDKIAKVEEDVTENSGVVSIYGERWDARSEDGKIYQKGSEVKIVRNESIIVYVKSIN